MSAIFSYLDFATVLITMSALKSIAISSYWSEEINAVHVISVLMCANTVIFLTCPRWTNMHVTTPVFSYLFHYIFDMLFCEYMDTSQLFLPDKVGRSASKILLIMALFLMALSAYSQPIYVCVAEWKEKRNQSELKKKE